MAGSKGMKGSGGSAGDGGMAGEAGSAGAAGSSGMSGSAGEAGSSGMAGAAGSGGSSGAPDDGGSPESGPSCDAPTAGGITLSEDYQATLGLGGYCFAFADGDSPCSPCGTSTACAATSTLCGTGTSELYGGSNWGAGIGCNLNQKKATKADPMPAALNTKLSGSGLTYSLSNLPTGGDTVYMTVDNGGTEYYCALSAASGTCTWDQFNTAPWTTTGIYLVGAPSASHVEFEVAAGSAAESWTFCVVSITIAP
jgi:hypothetical protein